MQRAARLVLLLPHLKILESSLFPPLSARERGARDVVEALFGSEKSARAFSRQRLSMEQVASAGLTSRSLALTYGEFDLEFFFHLLARTNPQPGEGG